MKNTLALICLTFILFGISACSALDEVVEQAPIVETTKLESNAINERAEYIKQYCLDQNIENLWYLYTNKETGKKGWKNTSNDEVMVPATHQMIFPLCFDSEKTKGFAAVLDGDPGIWYRDTNGEKIIQAYSFDNGSDYFKEGLARFLDNEKIGFMNENLEIIIPAQFDGAYFFKDGIAKICKQCELSTSGEHSSLVGGKWGVVDKNGVVTWD